MSSPSDTAARRGSRDRRFYAAAGLIAALGLALAAWGALAPVKAAGSAVPADAHVVNMADLTPLYLGAPTTWQRIQDLRAHGRARKSLVYSDDTGALAAYFDTADQRTAWSCSPAAPAQLRPQTCPGSTPTGAPRSSSTPTMEGRSS